jgi:hypothetical protein
VAGEGRVVEMIWVFVLPARVKRKIYEIFMEIVIDELVDLTFFFRFQKC